MSANQRDGYDRIQSPVIELNEYSRILVPSSPEYTNGHSNGHDREMEASIVALTRPDHASDTLKQDFVKSIIRLIGDDPEREGLTGTPDRVVRSWQELYSGYHANISEVLTWFSEPGYRGLITMNGIHFWSMCEHHMLPFGGTVDIGYLPKGHVIGISKLARLVEVFARRLQLQERLTQQIASALYDEERTHGVIARIRATHSCMTMRGVKQPEPSMITMYCEGHIDDATVNDFLRGVA